MYEVDVLIGGLSFGESPRWHDGRLWVCDWGAEELIAVDSDGAGEVICRVPSFFPGPGGASAFSLVSESAHERG